MLDELIYREAAAAGRRPSPASVTAEVSAARARFDSAEAFAVALAENGLDEAAFRARLARAVLVRECRDAHSRVTVGEADIAAYYRENAARFQRPEQVHLRQILFRVDPGRPGDRRAGRGEGAGDPGAPPRRRAVRHAGAPRV